MIQVLRWEARWEDDRKFRDPRKRSLPCPGRSEVGQNVRDLPQTRDWSSAVLSLEERDGERGSGCAWGRSAAAPADEEQAKRIKQLDRVLRRSRLQIEILKNVLGE